MEFEGYVRNKLRELIGAKGWSVSRFASRYVQAYADKYSKMEAPSTSTARKLIEDNQHVLSEREAIVLDSFTQMNFHELWLEEQKRQLLSKSEQYVSGTHPQKELDSEVLLEDRIRALERVGKTMSMDDVASVVRRYASLQLSKPLVIFSESLLMIDIVLNVAAPTATRLTSEQFSGVRVMPPSACMIVDDDNDNIEDALESVLALNNRRSFILAVKTTNDKMIRSIKEKWQQDAIFFNAQLSGTMITSLPQADIEASLQPINAERLVKCLKVRTDYPDIFKVGIMACINSPWVIFPDFNDERDCMRFLDRQYQRLAQLYDDKTLSSYLVVPFLQLAKNQIPTYWLTDQCDQQSLLTAMAVFEEWSKQQELNQEALSRFRNADFDRLILFGIVPTLNREGWENWIREHYNLNLFFTMDYAHYYIDNIAERKRREKIKNKR